MHLENVDQKTIFYNSDETENIFPFYIFFSTFQNIFGSLCTQVFYSRALVSERGDVNSFVLCCEIKSQLQPKYKTKNNVEFQSATWSEYKHHKYS